MRLLYKWVFHNWHLKLFALLAAFLLWFTYTSEPASEVAYVVPIEYRHVPQNLEISGDVPTQVRLRLRGRPTLLRRLTPADLAITLDLAGRNAGEFTIALTPEMIDAPYGATVVGTWPEEIRLKLVPRK